MIEISSELWLDFVYPRFNRLERDLSSRLLSVFLVPSRCVRKQINLNNLPASFFSSSTLMSQVACAPIWLKYSKFCNKSLRSVAHSSSSDAIFRPMTRLFHHVNLDSAEIKIGSRESRLRFSFAQNGKPKSCCVRGPTFTQLSALFGALVVELELRKLAPHSTND